MAENFPKSLKELFCRAARRRRLAWFSCLRYNFMDALAHDKFDFAREVIDLVPGAVHWRGGQSMQGVWGDDCTVLRTVLWSKDHAEKIHYLVDRGADVNASGTGGYTALHQAIGIFDKEGIPALLARGGDPDQPNSAGETPRQLARHLDEIDKRNGHESREILPFLEEAERNCVAGNIRACTGGTPHAVRALRPLRLSKK